MGGGGGVCLSACWDTTPREQTPHPEQTPPRSRHPPSRHPPEADTPLEQTLPWEQTPPQSTHPPGADTTTPHPPGADTPQSRPLEQTPPPGSRHLPRERQPLLRTVRILLECILVKKIFPCTYPHICLHRNPTCGQSYSHRRMSRVNSHTFGSYGRNHSDSSPCIHLCLCESKKKNIQDCIARGDSQT